MRDADRQQSNADDLDAAAALDGSADETEYDTDAQREQRQQRALAFGTGLPRRLACWSRRPGVGGLVEWWLLGRRAGDSFVTNPDPPPSRAILLLAAERLVERSLQGRLAADGLTLRHVGVLGHLRRSPGPPYSELALPLGRVGAGDARLRRSSGGARPGHQR